MYVRGKEYPYESSKFGALYDLVQKEVPKIIVTGGRVDKKENFDKLTRGTITNCQTSCQIGKTGKNFAVRCTLRPAEDDIKREKQFYSDALCLWRHKDWSVRYFDYFDDNKDVIYAVTDKELLQGCTLADWYKEHAAETVSKRLKRLSRFFKKFLEIVKDLESEGKVNVGLCPGNIIVIEHGKDSEELTLKLVDHSKYMNYENGENIYEKYIHPTILSLFCTIYNYELFYKLYATGREAVEKPNLFFDASDENAEPGDFWEACWRLSQKLEKVFGFKFISIRGIGTKDIIISQEDILKIPERLDELVEFSNKWFGIGSMIGWQKIPNVENTEENN